MADLNEKKENLQGELNQLAQQRQQADQVLTQTNAAIIATQAKLQLIAELEGESPSTEEPE